MPSVAHTSKGDCIGIVLFSLSGMAFDSVYIQHCVEPVLCTGRMNALTYNPGAHLLALLALFVFTLPDVLTFHTLFALLRLAERRKQFCAFTAYSPNNTV